MDLLKIALSSVLSIIVIFILTKLIGNKQLSEANIFDYINGITVGSIAAEMATSLEKDILKPLVSMIVYTLIVMLIALLNRKSIKLRRIFSGKSIILLHDDKIYYDNLVKAGIDINDFLVQCRINGFFDIGEIQTAIFETNGKISMLPKESSRNLQPKDTKLKVEQSEIMANLIIDGKVIDENLNFCQKTKSWLSNILKKQFNLSKIEDIFLCTYDGKEKINVYKKVSEKNNDTPFE